MEISSKFVLKNIEQRVLSDKEVRYLDSIFLSVGLTFNFLVFLVVSCQSVLIKIETFAQVSFPFHHLLLLVENIFL